MRTSYEALTAPDRMAKLSHSFILQMQEAKLTCAEGVSLLEGTKAEITRRQIK